MSALKILVNDTKVERNVAIAFRTARVEPGAEPITGKLPRQTAYIGTLLHHLRRL